MTAEELIKEAESLTEANAGIMAIVRHDCCIMDKECCCYPYKDEGQCPDYRRCDHGNFMLACIATRSPEQISSWVLETYSLAMEEY